MSESIDAFLAECEDVITDWQGSPDAARWSGDGSHEVETNGYLDLSNPHRDSSGRWHFLSESNEPRGVTRWTADVPRPWQAQLAADLDRLNGPIWS